MCKPKWESCLKSWTAFKHSLDGPRVKPAPHFLAVCCPKWRIPNQEIKFTHDPKLYPEWRGFAELECIHETCLFMSPRFAWKSSYILPMWWYLSFWNEHKLHVWVVNNITYASDSDISANCFSKPFHALPPHCSWGLIQVEAPSDYKPNNYFFSPNVFAS